MPVSRPHQTPPVLKRLALAGLLTLSVGVGGAAPALPSPPPAKGGSELPLSLPARVAALLPQSGELGQLMRLGSRITTVDLQRAVTDAGGNAAALRSVMTAVAKGQVPTYDARLNISRETFGRYIAFQPVLEGTGKVMRLTVNQDPRRVTLGAMPGAASILRGLSFDLKTGELQVPEGFIFKPAAISAVTAKDRSIDIRGGVQWNLNGYDPITQNGIYGQLSLYQVGSGQALLTFERMNMVRGIPGQKSSVMLSYAR
ncbi:hypothetical protein SAMN04488058_103102 [Deinococcus reticulitermitis]|uniref:Uncharacterized protein n=1 Tax=Deinococcus reticulitermitis TaxID=856736 RepID=A0A1H6VN22_9DEIO|nr:hypothetical protein [Deinococcus reticulitermitis]SEJ01495.1 hypothetical protein SAMN04488058_103102 [Deinococcus reticulitermitis]